jgi:helix-turn-helix protein
MSNSRRTRTSRIPGPAPGTAGTSTGDPNTGEPNTGDRNTGTPNTDKPKAGEVWTVERIRALGATTDLRTAAAIFGLSANTAYDLARRGRFPVEVIRVGAQYRVSVPAILTVLGAAPAPIDPRPPPDS